MTSDAKKAAKKADKALALMVYDTWVLNGCSAESLPCWRLRRWCNHQLGRRLFPLWRPSRLAVSKESPRAN